MWVSPFWAGVIITVIAELMALFVYVVINNKNGGE